MKFKGIELKQLDEEGRGIARIARLNTIDKDGDVTKAGAFGEQIVKMLPAHNWDSVPLGKARVFEQGEDVLAEFTFNLETQAGREWHSALKFDLANGKPTQEWSYGFTIPAGGSDEGEFDGQIVRFLKRLEVHEISPVVVGAGNGTGTLAVKGKPCAVLKDGQYFCRVDGEKIVGKSLAALLSKAAEGADVESVTGLSAETFKSLLDGELNCPTPDTIKTLAADLSLAEDDIRAAMKADGCPGMQADRPDTAGDQESFKRFADQIEATVKAVADLAERAEKVAELRAQEVRGLPQSRVKQIEGLTADLKGLCERLDAITRYDDQVADQLLAEFEATVARAQGVVTE